MFYNTGIATYVWVISNRKAENRKGTVQLIDATQWFKPLRKNLGKKNCELSDEDIQRICDTYLAFKETEQSKIFPNAAFGYWKVTVERPLRLKVDLGDERRRAFRLACAEADEEPIANVVDRIAETLGPGPHTDFNAFYVTVERDADKYNVKITAKRKKLLQTVLAVRDEGAKEVIAKVHKAGKEEPDPLHGLYLFPSPSAPSGRGKGEGTIVEYEPDPEIRDTEQIPLLEDGGIDAFIRREVLPYAPDAWIDESKTEVGYEISFTRHFYRPQPLRSLEEIRADILALEKETEGFA
jgi:type I restriction enzyme M protein